MTRTTGSRAVLAAVAGTAALMLYVRASCVEKALAGSGPPGRAGTGTIAAAAERVCDGLLPDSRTVIADDVDDVTTDGRPQRMVEYQYRDNSQHYQLTLLMDAGSGEIVFIHLTPRRWAESGHASAAAAVESAKAWMRFTGVADQSRSWTLLCPPRRSGSEWTVCWRGADRAALVTVGGNDARLYRLLTTRMPPYGPGWFPWYARTAIRRSGLEEAVPRARGHAPGPRA